MTREEAMEEINKAFEPAFANYIITALTEGVTASDKALEQETCEDAVSRKAVLDAISDTWKHICFVARRKHPTKGEEAVYSDMCGTINRVPPVTPKRRLCKDCKFFETDSWAKVGEIPLIVAHEICTRWGDGCKTSEDGYCFLFEPKEGESE